jgi:hypothetical protein
MFHPEKATDVWGADLGAGAERRDPARGLLEIVVGTPLAICNKDEATALRDLSRPRAALYIGGMGARDRNF